MVTLVTGASGFIGQHVVRKLAMRGDRVRLLARPGSKLGALSDLNLEIVQGDVIQPDTLPAAFDGVDRLFHMAGLVTFVQSEIPRLQTVNVEGTRNILGAALRAGVQRVVYTSSVSAVGYSKRPQVVTESSPWVDFGISYARSKREAEEVALQYFRQGLPVVIVNPTTAMGANDPNLTSTAPVARFLRGDLKVTVRGALNVIDIDDLADGHLRADERGRIGERYILGGNNVSWTQFFGILSDLSGRPAPRRVPSALALGMAKLMEATSNLTGRPPKFHVEEVRAASLYRIADSTKADRELGLQHRSLRETLSRTVDWLKTTDPAL
ncbi:MAG: SDR family oxidoreductase [Chloroflexota bacterium]